MEGGGARPSLETLEKLAAAVGGQLVGGVGENLSNNRSIAKVACMTTGSCSSWRVAT
jgi:hypothetical protein